MELDRPHTRRVDQAAIPVLTNVIHLQRVPERIAMSPQMFLLLGKH
jgi:hypothetical protein